MSTEQTDAIVLRVYPWSETSCVATIFTRDFGKLSVLAKGARRPKSPFEAALDLLSVCRVVFISKSGDALDLLTEAKLMRRFRAGSRDLLRLYCGYYIAELLDRLTDKGDKHTELYELADETLNALADRSLEVRAIVLRMELQALRVVGHLPTWRQCAQCHREVIDSEDAVFGVLAGGVLCESCRDGQRQRIVVPSAARSALEQYSHPEWRRLDLQNYITEHRAVVRGVVKHYLMALLDRRSQLDSYLEELGR